MFVGHGCSYIIGAFLCALILERLNPDFMLGCTILAMITGTAFAPFSGSVYGFCGLVALNGLFFAYVDTGLLM